MEGVGYIYFAQAEDQPLYKIGMTIREPLKRVKGMSTGCPYKLHIVGWFEAIDPMKAERRVHKELHEYRTKGEWFQLETSQVIKLLEKYRSVYDVTLNFERYYSTVAKPVNNAIECDSPNNINSILVLISKIDKDGITVKTEKCPFCGKQHNHGTGGVEAPIEVVGEFKTLGHRIAHCDSRNICITLPNGARVSNNDGYYLGLTKINPDAKISKGSTNVKGYIRATGK